MIRRVKVRKSQMELNQQEEQQPQTRNQKMEKQVDRCLRYHQHQANKAELKIMMMERKKQKEINSRRNQKIDEIE